MQNIDRWTIVFKVLSNANRLKIIELLNNNKKMYVGLVKHTCKLLN